MTGGNHGRPGQDTRARFRLSHPVSAPVVHAHVPAGD